MVQAPQNPLKPAEVGKALRTARTAIRGHFLTLFFGSCPAAERERWRRTCIGPAPRTFAMRDQTTAYQDTSGSSSLHSSRRALSRLLVLADSGVGLALGLAPESALRPSNED